MMIVVAQNKCEYFGYNESNLFMKHLHFIFNQPMFHSTCTLKPTCILLNVCSASWFACGSSFCHPTQHIMNIFSPMYLDCPSHIQSNYLHGWNSGTILVNVWMPQNGHIMIRFKIINIYVHEQPMMVKIDHVVHCINILPTIKLGPMCFIIP
jgi:hypothetical protein